MVSSATNGTEGFPETRAPEREADVLQRAIELIRDRLPATWESDVDPQAASIADAGVDAIVRVRAPSGEQAVFAIEAKRLLRTGEVPGVLESARRAAAAISGDGEATVVLAARYLAPATRERIAASGAGYIDATGNLLLTAERPAIYLADRGADRDPWRGPGRPRGTLKGPPAARVVRALIDFAPPYTVPELAERSEASTGATYRVVEFLEGEGLIERQRYGPITTVDWRTLVTRWADDYGFAQSNTVETFLEPRGLEALLMRLKRSEGFDYAVTGSLAAVRVAPFAPARLATVYVSDLRAAIEALALRPAESGANVALAVGAYDVALERTEIVDGVRFAALSQAAVDLLTGPGRSPSEATALLDWMQSDESRWRR